MPTPKSDKIWYPDITPIEIEGPAEFFELRRDVPYLLKMPTDLINEEGMELIYTYWNGLMFYFRDHLQNAKIDIKELGNEWLVTKTDDNHPNVGTLPKRFGKLWHQATGKKLEPNTIAEVGNIAKRYTNSLSHYIFDITEDLDWNPGDFGDKNSCLWTFHRETRELLSDNGGHALRFFRTSQQTDQQNRYFPEMSGYGRCWIYVNRHDPLELFLFNGVGGLQLLEQTRVLATLLGLSYRKCIIGSGLMINGNAGTTIAKTPNPHVEIFLFEGDYRTVCDHCNDFIDQDDAIEFHGETFCPSCHEELIGYCEECLFDYWKDELVFTENGVFVCANCTRSCEECNKIYNTESIYYNEYVGMHLCEDCYDAAEKKREENEETKTTV